MPEEITVIIPAYNEQDSIESTIEQVFRDVPGARVLVVNDNSRDRTLEILTMLQKKHRTLDVITHPKNRGYGGALKTGFRNARTTYLSFLDADLTYPPDRIPVLLRLVKEKNMDCAWCNRFTKESRMPLVRKIGNKLLVALFLLVTQRYVPDISSGERVFRKASLDRIDPQSLPDGLDMITAMTKRIITRKLRYALVTCSYAQRGGSSKLNIVTDFLRMSRNILFER